MKPWIAKITFMSKCYGGSQRAIWSNQGLRGCCTDPDELTICGCCTADWTRSQPCPCLPSRHPVATVCVRVYSSSYELF